MHEHHSHSAAGLHARRLALVLLLTLGFLVVEVVAAWLTGSLALLADAGHMFTDVVGLALALLAIWFARRPATPAKSYGYYRLEILAALTNGVLLWGIAAYILFEAYQRISHPQDIMGLPVLATAVAGLAVNLLSIRLLFEGQKSSLNLRGAFLEVVSDLVSSLAVIVSAALILATGAAIIDPLVSVFIALFILPRTWRLIGEAAHVLLEGVPRNVDVGRIREQILQQQGVLDVHDLHVWSLTSGMDVLSAHVVVEETARSQEVLDRLCHSLASEFEIEHCTFQIEQPDRSHRESSAH